MRRDYMGGTVKHWMKGMLSGDKTIRQVAAGIPANSVGYAIVSHICKSAIALKAQGKRIELRIVDIEPGNEAEVVVDGVESEGEVANG